MEKKEILKNVQSYSADQLSEWIRQNVVTLDELRATGMLLKITERRITAILAKSPESSVDAFNRGKEQLSSVTSRLTSLKTMKKIRTRMTRRITTETPHLSQMLQQPLR